MLQTLKRINKPDLVAQVKDYVWKRNILVFNLKEKIKQFFKKPTDYDLIESKLIELADSNYNPSLLKKEKPCVQVLPRKYLRDLTKEEKDEIVIHRLYGKSVNELIRDFYLQNKLVISHVVAQNNREEGRKSFGRLSNKEKEDISWLNKEGITAKELVKEYKLSGVWVVYRTNREQKRIKEQIIKNKEEQITKLLILQPSDIYQPAAHIASA
ncbi:MAG: hypothetical protein COT09_05800 [Candidatus Hydromicrobium americanum]|nr:MAG: hypothetical protein COT09_05800 [Candidatus Hydromicrobium americanum]